MDDGTELVNKLPDGGAPETLQMAPSVEPQSTHHATPAQFQIPPTQAAAPKRRRVWPWLVAGAAALFIVALGLAVVARLLINLKKPLVHHLVMRVEYDYGNRDYLATSAAAVIKTRLNALGVSPFEVKPGAPGSGEILVDLPKLDNPERVKQIISTLGKLEFVHVVGPSSPAPAQTFDSEEEANVSLNSDQTINGRVLPYLEEELAYLEEELKTKTAPKKKWVIVEVPAIVDGFDLREARAVPSPIGDGGYEIQFSLKKDGADHFGSWTGSHINEYIGVALNDEVRSIAFIKSQIFDRGVIAGRYTKQSAEDLALVLNAGALPAPVQFVSEKIDN
jgi:preprotein translocase subunit SecD